MTDAYVAWQLAELEQQVDAYSSFLDACPWTDTAVRLRCRDLADSARKALSLGMLDEGRFFSGQLVEHAWEWRHRPGYPDVCRPEEADGRARDLVKDVLRRGDFAPIFRKQVSDLKLSIEVTYGRLIRHPDLDQCVRGGVGYVYGRATMALDLGHFAAAQRELARLRGMYEDLSMPVEGEAATA